MALEVTADEVPSPPPASEAEVDGEVASEDDTSQVRPPRRWPGRLLFAACLAAGGAAEIWMNFTINADGFGRLLVRDHHLGRRQAGRLRRRGRLLFKGLTVFR